MIKYLIEIKNRIYLIALTFLSTVIVSYFYKEILLFLVVQSHRFVGKKASFSNFYFIFTDITEVFSVYLQIIIFFCAQVVTLYLIYNTFLFFSFALYHVEYSFVVFLLKICSIVWVLSILFSTYLLIPLTWNFFSSFQELAMAKFITLHFEPQLNKYLNFYISLYGLCTFYCQIFTIFFIFCYINFSIGVIKKFRKIYYYGFFIFSTLLSPPDIFSQVFLSLALILVYEILIFVFITKKELIR